MFNIGGGEMLVIALLALIVLGPQRLPGAARQAGKALTELRRMSAGFQNELKSALNEADSASSASTAAATTTTPIANAIGSVSEQAAPTNGAAATKATAPAKAATKRAPARKAPSTKAAAKKAPGKKAPAKKASTAKGSTRKASKAPAKAAKKSAPAISTGSRRRTSS